MKKKSNFIVQGSILAMAGILSRIIGIAKRVPMQHIIGNTGNGYYSVAFEIYNIMLIISCYSLPLAVSKVVSAKLSKKQYKNAERAFHCALAFSILTGGLCFAVAEVFGDYLAADIMKQPMSAMALKVLGPAILIVAIMGVFRGYFQGLGTMMPTAISQIIEQIFVMIVSIAGAYFCFQKGVKVGNLLHNENYAYAYGAAGATLGTVVGALTGLLFLLFVYMAYRPRMKRMLAKDSDETVDSYKIIFRLMILTMLPVLLSSTVYNISNIIDIRIYNAVMTQKGLEDSKASIWGIYSGEYRVLINVPIALANAMCSSIVPVLSGLFVQHDIKMIRAKISQAMRFTMLIAIPSAVGLAVLARPTITLLFSGEVWEVDLAVELLHLGTTLVIFLSMSTLTNGVLQGISRMKVPVCNALIALIIHIIFLYATMQMDMGVHAVVYANILFAIIVCILNHLAIRKYTQYKQELYKTFILPGIASAAMGIVIFVINMLLSNALTNVSAKISSAIIVFVGITIGVIVYFAVLLCLKGVTESDLRRIPGGTYVLRIAKGLHLL